MMICKTCQIDKPLTSFYKMGKYYRKECIECMSAKKKNNYNTNKTAILNKNKDYRLKNKQKISKQKKQYAKELAKYDSFGLKLEKFEEIQRDPKNQELLQVRCSYCGRWMNPTNQQVNTRLKCYLGTNTKTVDGLPRTHGEGKFYCSESCKINCPIYKKKTTPEGSTKKLSREVNPQFRKMVFQEDNYTCLFCGASKNDNPELELHCHHIIPYAVDPIQDCDIDNAITVCKECHKWIHTTIDGCKYWDICK